MLAGIYSGLRRPAASGSIACAFRFGYSTPLSPSITNYNVAASETSTTLGDTMKNPLDSLWGTVITGVVLTIILYYVVRLAL